MTAALAHFLPDFALGGTRPGTARRNDPSHCQGQSGGIDPLEAEQMCMDARNEARAAAEAELSAQYEAEVAALKTSHQAEVAALTARLSALAAEAVPAAVSARADAIADEIARDVAAVLGPIAEAKVVERMVAALAAEVRTACQLNSATAVAVTGPKELVAALRSRLAGLTGEVTYIENEDTDLVLLMDKTTWTTRLKSWSAALEGEIG